MIALTFMSKMIDIPRHIVLLAQQCIDDKRNT